MKGGFGKTGLLCLALLLALGATGVGLAHWQRTLTIRGTVRTGTWELGGTPGFWGGWDKHNAYTRGQVEEWLLTIDDTSLWLVPDMDANSVINISDMQAVFAAGQGGTKEEKFLSHYVATRLNVEAGRLYPDTIHYFSSYDPDNYLGLGGQGTLEQIIGAIESKHGTSPTEDHFEIMKNMCDALNNLAI